MTLELTQVQLEYYFASISQHSTIQIVKKFDIKNRILLVKKILSPTTFMKFAAPAPYCVPTFGTENSSSPVNGERVLSIINF